MAVKHIDSRYFQVPTVAIVNAVHATLLEMCKKAPVWAPEANRAVAYTGFSLASYGEMITVYVQDSGEVVVSSECSFPLQLVDWGKNRKNCERILNSVASRLSVGSPSF